MHKYFFLSLFIGSSLCGADNDTSSFNNVFEVLTNPADGYFYDRVAGLAPRIELDKQTRTFKTVMRPFEIRVLKPGFTKEDVEAHNNQFFNSLSEDAVLTLLLLNRQTYTAMNSHRNAQIAKLTKISISYSQETSVGLSSGRVSNGSCPEDDMC